MVRRFMGHCLYRQDPENKQVLTTLYFFQMFLEAGIAF